MRDSVSLTQESFEELLILDIDDQASKNSKPRLVKTTGGGSYHLLLMKSGENAQDLHPYDPYREGRKQNQRARLRLRYYIDRYMQSGQARVCDWRMVSLEEE